MNPDATKCICVSDHVMCASFSPCLLDGPACETKQNQLIPDYMRIANYHSQTGHNVANYWKQSVGERKAEGLPRAFSKEVFNAIHEWYRNRPQIQPPHICNFLVLRNGNFHGQQRHDLSDAEDKGDEEPKTDNSMEVTESDFHGSPS